MNIKKTIPIFLTHIYATEISRNNPPKRYCHPYNYSQKEMIEWERAILGHFHM